jgi:hypothetical protein
MIGGPSIALFEPMASDLQLEIVGSVELVLVWRDSSQISALGPVFSA